MNKIKFLLVLITCIFFAVSNSFAQKTKSKKLKVIFETDMGNDIDDALALDMLYKYQDQGLIEILAICTNKNTKYAVPYIDVLNRFYGYPNIPIGAVRNGANSEGDARNYAQLTLEHKIAGKPAFVAKKTDKDVPNAVNLYRQILSKEADQSVIVISVGFSTNLARLLDTKADKNSQLSGKDLVAKKVKFLSIMAGNFDPDTAKRFVEYNVAKDVPAARKVFASWPTEVVISPYALGEHILYPATSIQQDFTKLAPHPMVIGYESYLDMPYDRPTWDLTSVLYAVEGNQKAYFKVSERGNVEVAANGKTYYTAGNGSHYILSADEQQNQKIQKRLIELISSKPKNK